LVAGLTAAAFTAGFVCDFTAGAALPVAAAFAEGFAAGLAAAGFEDFAALTAFGALEPAFVEAADAVVAAAFGAAVFFAGAFFAGSFFTAAAAVALPALLIVVLATRSSLPCILFLGLSVLTVHSPRLARLVCLLQHLAQNRCVSMYCHKGWPCKSCPSVMKAMKFTACFRTIFQNSSASTLKPRSVEWHENQAFVVTA
jgi:hypothetical protein